MTPTRRTFLKSLGAAAALALAPAQQALAEAPGKRHIVTLSFDDGFKKSFVRTAEIYEKFKLSACLNVIASAHLPGFKPPDQYIDVARGDFALWNELQRRGHEVMPHGWAHENLRQLPIEQATDSIQRCLDLFSEKLEGFKPRQAVFNFPYNASTPAVEQWLAGRVRAFRTGGAALNPLPHKGQARLTCRSSGPANAEAALDKQIAALLARESGWLIFNTHGLDEEGWGPIRANYLEQLLERLLAIETVEILPAGKALAQFASARQ